MSSPEADYELALKANADLLDALYRLSFTSDKLKSAEVDCLVNQLKNHLPEVTVLLGRVLNVKKNGFDESLFQGLENLKAPEVESNPINELLPKPAADKSLKTLSKK
jgi:hypothetical protein